MWRLTAFATPDPEYLWYNPKGELIERENDEHHRFNLDISKSTHIITLRIENLRYDNSV